jgi:hypothetical protein
VLGGNVGELAVPLQVLFLYRGLPDIVDDAGASMVPSPQALLTDDAKALLEPDELLELDAGTLSAEELRVDKPAGLADKEALRGWVTHLQSLYRARRTRFLRDRRNVHSLRGLVIDAKEDGGGIKLAAVEAR